MFRYYILIILLTLVSLPNIASAQSQKCDIDKLLIINKNMDDLSFQMIEDFLLTFDESCKNNVEYSEWSADLLVKVIDRYPKLYFKVLTSDKISNESYILKTFSNPLSEYNYQKLYDKINVIETDKSIKSNYLKCLIEIAKNSGFEIKK